MFITQRQPSKTYGDLKKLQPITRPFVDQGTGANDLRSPHGGYVDGTRSSHAELSNCSAREVIQLQSPIHGCRNALALSESCDCGVLLDILVSTYTEWILCLLTITETEWSSDIRHELFNVDEYTLSSLCKITQMEFRIPSHPFAWFCRICLHFGFAVLQADRSTLFASTLDAAC